MFIDRTQKGINIELDKSGSEITLHHNKNDLVEFTVMAFGQGAFDNCYGATSSSCELVFNIAEFKQFAAAIAEFNNKIPE